MNEQLVAIECVVLLFWNYTSDDITLLRNESHEFDHVWRSYIADSANSYQDLWRCWQTKFSYRTKELIIDYAIRRFGEEKRQNIAFADGLKRRANPS